MSLAQPIPQTLSQIPDGHYTTTIYSLLASQNFRAVYQILTSDPSTTTQRAGLSLLAYCCYQMQDFTQAASYYEQLVRMIPDNQSYKLSWAQCLYKAGNYNQATKACLMVEGDSQLKTQVTKLQAAIKYETADIVSCRTLVESLPQGDADTLINTACLLYKDGKYEQACNKYVEAMKVNGWSAELCYWIALCMYQRSNWVGALKYLAEIIERGIREHPELSVGMATEGMEVRSVGNSQTLHETYLIEAFNLKAAIEFRLHNFDSAREALTDMPPRLESELDPVTLHNQALMNMETDPSSGFEKMTFLLTQGISPPETFANLLLLYLKYEYLDTAADLLAQNSQLAYQNIQPHLLEYIEGVLLRQSSKEESYIKLDDLGNKHVDRLRKLTKSVQEARNAHDEEGVKKAVNEYDEAVEKYIPVLMAQAKIHWDTENYPQVERIFRKSVEFCNEHDAWKLNVAHVLFMQDKYKEAISFYEPIVKKNYDNLLNVTAIVLANLCVSYIMTSQNEDAEDLMRKIEKEEEHFSLEDPTKRTYHLCIVNLVIGTLYCAKGNHEFGISRIMKSMEPFNKKLGTDTWFYAKRCFAALLETLAKHMITLKDSVYQDILAFLDQCELHGKNIPAVVQTDLMHPSEAQVDPAKNSVAWEARFLKALYLKLNE